MKSSFPNQLPVEENIVNLSTYLSVNGLEDFDLDIYTITGRKVVQFSNSKGRIDLSGLNPGIYLVQVKCGTQTFIRKLIKE